MELKVTSTWEQLNNKLSTNKFGAYVRTQAGVQITYETTPTNSTKGKLYNFGETINVDPSIDVYVKSRGEETTLVLDENFYEEGEVPSPSENTGIINCTYTLIEGEAGSGNFAHILEIFDSKGVKMSFSNLDKNNLYRGFITSKPSTNPQYGVWYNTSGSNYDTLRALMLFKGDYSSFSTVYSDSLSKSLPLILYFNNTENAWIVSPESLNPTSTYTPSSDVQPFTKDVMNTFFSDSVSKLLRNPSVFNADSILTNSNLLLTLTAAWYKNSVITVRNLKFTNFDFKGASGNIYGNMSFKFIRDASDIPLETYRLKVTIDYIPTPLNKVYKLERIFGLNYNSTTGLYSISNTETFYDESKWTFYKTGFSEITNVGMFPISGWVNWVALDTQAKSVIITLEYVGTCMETFTIPINALKARTEYSLSIGGNWFVLRISGTNIQFSCPSNGTLGTIVKVNNACFLYD